MTLQEIKSIVAACRFKDWRLLVSLDTHGSIYLQACFTEADSYVGSITNHSTRKWLISEHMVKSEIVQTVFKCVSTAVEHEAREAFLYDGEKVFGPHFDVDALAEVCRTKKLDYRRTLRAG